MLNYQIIIKKYEIILIDNAATGNYPNILKKHASKDKRIILYSFDKNQWASGAVNKGIEISSSQYFLIVDSDDYLQLDACEQLSKIIEKNNVDCIIYW